MPAVEFYKDA